MESTCKFRFAILAAALAAGLTGVSAHAAVMAWTSATLSPSPDPNVDEPTQLVDFTVSSGTYSVFFTPASTADVSSTSSLEQNGWAGGNTDTDSDGVSDLEEDGAESLLGTRIDSGVLNIGDVTVQFNRTATATDLFFLAELGGNDDPVIKPVDSSGNVIGNYELQIATSDWGGIATLVGSRDAGETDETAFPDLNLSLSGLAFSLSDFEGDTIPLTNVTGLLIDDNGLDLTAAGIAVIPEPASLALLGLGGLCLLPRRRA